MHRWLSRRWLTGRSLNPEDGDSVFPQRLELIELALKRRQHVHYHPSIIGQEPSRTGSLLVESTNTALIQGIEYGFPNRSELALTVTGAHEEIVCEGARAFQVEQYNIDCLLL